MSAPQNNGLQLTKAARCAPRATTQGQPVRRALQVKARVLRT